MANLKEIRNRIASVTSTMQMTSAMKMVSNLKMYLLLPLLQTEGCVVRLILTLLSKLT